MKKLTLVKLNTAAIYRALEKLADAKASHAAEVYGRTPQGAKIDPDAELRIDTVDALVAEGKARHVAANIVNSPTKLMTEARRLQLI